MIVLTSLVAALAVFLFVLWYARSKGEMEVRVRALGEQQRLVVEYQDPFSQRVAFPVVDGLVRGLMAVLPTSLVTRARRWLVIAGDTMSLSQFMTIVLVTATLPAALVFVIAAAASSGVPSGGAVAVVGVVAVLGLLGPFFLLRSRARARQKNISRSMPNTLDLMTTCVEAGLSLDFALQRVADRYKGPLADEIHRALREIGMGKTRREALGDMAERVDIPDLHTFVNSMAQAEQLGTSVGAVLRVQAKQMRMRRRQAAEQMARKAPVKMVFPLVFFFIPSLFIVVIGPIALHAWQNLLN
jgi:tight adherence protein C